MIIRTHLLLPHQNHATEVHNNNKLTQHLKHWLKGFLGKFRRSKETLSRMPSMVLASALTQHNRQKQEAPPPPFKSMCRTVGKRGPAGLDPEDSSPMLIGLSHPVDCNATFD